MSVDITLALILHGAACYNTCVCERLLMSDTKSPGASINSEGSPDGDALSLSPVAAGHLSIVSPRSTTSLIPVVDDERAVARLLETLLHRSGLTVTEAARRLGVTPGTIRQYTTSRRTRPSLQWFVRFATLCGGRVTLEYPER
jgi:hypothetical protein